MLQMKSTLESTHKKMTKVAVHTTVVYAVQLYTLYDYNLLRAKRAPSLFNGQNFHCIIYFRPHVLP